METHLDFSEAIPRVEGVYCHWERSGPIRTGAGLTLVIERVCGDGSVERFSCTDVEADSIREFLNA
jgi:hypothetical protein